MILEWKPFRRQEEFLSLPDSIFEALYGGAAGGGKSESLLLLPIVRGFHQHPRFKGIIFRRTYPELESEIIVRSHTWYPHCGAKYSAEKKRWTFPNGSIMQFGHVEYENDVRKYDTSEYNYMAFDELTSFTEFQYTYLSLTRCRSSSPQLPAIVRSGTNPGNVGHSWVKRKFIDPGPYGTIFKDKGTGIKRIFIQSLVSDNPHIEAEYAKRMELLPEAERRAKLHGDWETFEGQAFEDFRENPIPGDPPNAIHVIKPFKVPDWWTRVLAVDWGYAAMTVALWGALSPENRLYIYREYSCRKTKISIWATEVGNLSFGEQLTDITMCQSAWQKRGEELTIMEHFVKFSGLKPRQAENDRLAGKIMVQEYLRWQPHNVYVHTLGEFSQTVATSILRNKGLDAYKQYIKSFEPDPEEANLPKLQIFDTCRELIGCIPKCIFRPKDKTSGKPAEDVAEFPGDDPYDTLRYLILSADALIDRNKVENTRRKDEHDIIDELEKTGDQNRFYNRMAQHERKSGIKSVIKPVIRRRHYV
jgi:hypothetical protein